MKASAVLRNPRVWVYLVVGIAAAGLIGYYEWRDSDEQRLQRCVEASISEMMQSNPGLAEFDNAGTIFDSMARGACKKHLGIS